ncbi:5-oxoprolinase subunit PxpB [Motiliproteus sp. SC1-56]|uniref:5-oxoprolinase subunit PxpB n=1 Tax=Motiliproteus sp. SC1-56 TaxID=2799565 RepID=UPI001A90919D|nr:5-oxoprolinase subunit PxpB [Motiliproteus sp. SC1-56]
MRIEALNEESCIVYLGETIDEAVSARVTRAVAAIREELGELLVDLVPSYTSILVCYDLTRIDRFGIRTRLRRALERGEAAGGAGFEPRTVELPVYYGPEVALDLADICEHAGLSPEEVVRIHSETDYRVYAIGFSPGFAYLGNTDRRIAMSRKSTPRLKVPSGSLGIADTQTAIYPSSTPGGWQVIGRTPLAMVDWSSASLARVQVGDRVRFRPISREEYRELGGRFDEL